MAQTAGMLTVGLWGRPPPPSICPIAFLISSRAVLPSEDQRSPPKEKESNTLLPQLVAWVSVSDSQFVIKQHSPPLHTVNNGYCFYVIWCFSVVKQAACFLRNVHVFPAADRPGLWIVFQISLGSHAIS